MKHSYSENAFTGLEAAIVLIAFVVVAAVFSYVVLGAGFFTTQTAQATVHTSVAQASSSIENVGNVYGIADAGADHLKYVNLTVALTAGGTAVDLSQMVISYNDNNGGHNTNLTYEGIAPDGGACTKSMAGGADTNQQWCIAEKINNQTSGPLLEPNAQMILSVGLPTTAQKNVKISINFQPAVGSVLPITRTIPGGINPVQALY